MQINAYDFYRGLYSLLNGVIVNVVLRDLHLHFQGQTFSCHAFAIKKNAQVADVPRKFVSTRKGPSSGVIVVLNVITFVIGILDFFRV